MESTYPAVMTYLTHKPTTSDLIHYAYCLAELCNQLLRCDVLLEVWVRFATTEISLGERDFWVILYNNKQTPPTSY